MSKLAVCVFIAVSGTMNALFALTLGSDEITKGCWLAVALAATLFTARGPELVHQALKARAWSRALAALVVLAPAICYDALAAYGFAHMEQTAKTNAIADKAEDRRAAEAERDRILSDLSKYAAAPDRGAAEARVQALAGRRDRKGRADIAAARIALADAEAKERLTAQLHAAQAKLAHTERPPAPDKRAELFGPEVIAWLPVVLLQLGSLLGMYATGGTGKRIAPQAPPAKAEPEKAPAKDRPPIVRLVSDLSAKPVDGVTIDKDGWVRAGQRRLAELLGYSLARFNREARAAAAAGLILLDTAHGTALKVA
jgi:hypothetical protein